MVRRAGAVGAAVAVLAGLGVGVAGPAMADPVARSWESTGLGAIRKPTGPLSARLESLVDRSAGGTADAASSSAAVGLPADGPGSLLRWDDGIVVNVRLHDPIAASRAAVEATGVEIIAATESGSEISVGATTAQIAVLRDLPGVRSVREELSPRVAGAAEQRRLAEQAADAARSAGVAASSADPAPADPPAVVCPGGDVRSEGDAVIDGPGARSTYDVDGTGVPVGVVSDSYNALNGAPTDVATGNLPGPGNPCGYTAPVQVLEDYFGSDASDEGRALAQIVHDVAPGAPLRFITAAGGELAMAQSIRDLASGGAKVIVDDIGYPTEPMFEVGPVEDAVDDVTDGGAAYFSAAGNANVLIGGANVGSIAAGYRPRSCPDVVPTGTIDCHSFISPGGLNAVTVGPLGAIFFRLGWDDRRDAITADYDLIVYDRGTGEPLAASVDDNLVTGDPAEYLVYVNETGTNQTINVQVSRFGGVARQLKVDMFAAQDVLAVNWGADGQDTVGPTLDGHPAAEKGVAVGAFPFTNTTVLEPYSSFGPSIRCWPSNAPRFTPCRSTTVGLSAPDGVLTSFFGVNTPAGYRFLGTSAAAPHAAAVAALAREHRPSCTPAQTIAAMKAGAKPLGSVPVHGTGAGRLDARSALASMPSCLPASQLTVEVPATALVNEPFTARVTARDSQGVVVPTYAANVNFDSTGPSASIPPNTPLVDGTAAITITPTATGTLTLTANAGFSAVSTPIVVGSADRFHAIDPFRVQDSRIESQVGPYSTKWGPQNTRDVKVTGGVVPEDAAAVVMNVTVTGTTADSFLSVYPKGEDAPLVSNLNWGTGVTIPNAVTVKVGAGGKVRVYNNSGQVHVIMDVVGYYSLDGGDGFTPLVPDRVVDSRPGPDNAGPYATPWGAGTARTVTVTGGTVPADASAVVANVTVANATADSFLQLWPTGQDKPLTSNLNYRGGQVIANAVTVKVGTGGGVDVFNNSGEVHVIIDVVGYFANGSGANFHPIAPVRKIDSRPGAETVGPFSTPWSAALIRDVPLTGGPVSPSATAVLGNFTVTGGSATSHLEVWPKGSARPQTSYMNFGPGLTIANSVTAKVGDSSLVRVYNNSGNVNVIIDISGWFG